MPVAFEKRARQQRVDVVVLGDEDVEPRAPGRSGLRACGLERLVGTRRRKVGRPVAARERVEPRQQRGGAHRADEIAVEHAGEDRGRFLEADEARQAVAILRPEKNNRREFGHGRTRMGDDFGAWPFRRVDRTDENLGRMLFQRRNEFGGIRHETDLGAREARAAGERGGEDRPVLENDHIEARQRFALRRRGVRDAEGEVHAKERPPADFALDLDGAAHRGHEMPADRKPEARALEAACMALIALLEFLEDDFENLGFHADARVLDLDDDRGALIRVGVTFEARAQQHAAPVGELDGVAGEVDEHLTDACFVADEAHRNMRLDLGDDLELLLEGARRQKFADAFERGAEIEGAFLDMDLAGLDLRIVENVVDDGEQSLARALDRLGIGALRRGELGVEQQVRHAEHAVHGRADLVAHRGEELALRAVRGLRLVERDGKTLFRLLAVGDVAADGLDFPELAVVVAQREFFPGEPAGPLRRDHALVEADAIGRQRETGEGAQHARLLALGEFRREGRAEDIGARPPEGLAEDVVHIGETAEEVAAQDDVALRLDEIAIALLAFGERPVLVAQALDLGLRLARLRLANAGAIRGEPPGSQAKAEHHSHAQKDEEARCFERKRHASDA